MGITMCILLKMTSTSRILAHYPWIKLPLICNGPKRLIALSKLAVEVSKAGGIGFIGSGNDQTNLETLLEDSRKLLQDSPLPSAKGTLPIGVGFFNWGANLDTSLPLLQYFRPAAVWFFAPKTISNLAEWTQKTREVTDNATKIWIQIGGVAEAVNVCKACNPDVLVVQGTDAGGHGLNHEQV